MHPIRLAPWLALAQVLPLPAALPPVPPSHVVVVVEENHGYSDIIGNGAAPYLNALAQGGALMTRSYAVTHPSQPNYLELFSGSTQGVTDDSCPHSFTAPNLSGQLLAAGRTFAGYSEDLPSAGYTGCHRAEYARKHNPWVMFSDVPASANQPFSAFPQGRFQDLPTVAFVIPNLDHDMHDGSIGAADAWLKASLDGYVQWARNHNSLLVVTFDEDDARGDNRIATLFAGPMVKPGRYSGTVTHDHLLRTLEDLYGLSHAGRAAAATAIADIWSEPGEPPAAGAGGVP
jgi:acid phosphatase